MLKIVESLEIIMNIFRIVVGVLVAFLSPYTRAQTAVVLGTDGGPLRVAPGQVVTFWMTGLTPTPSSGAKAMSTPFPTTLAGISATMTQAGGPKIPPVPIIAVGKGAGLCMAEQCEGVVGVTVQIPYELLVEERIPGCAGCITRPAWIVFSDSTNSKTLGPEILPYPDQIHVLAVTHGDGGIVTPSNPALVGEVIVMYASGLGYPKSLTSRLGLTTGDVTPSPPPDTPGALSYDFRVNASPSQARLTTPDPYLLYLGMSPGSVGLYNANFVVPPLPDGLPECDGISVSSNLTVTLVGATSFDGAAICVKNPGP